MPVTAEEIGAWLARQVFHARPRGTVRYVESELAAVLALAADMGREGAPLPPVLPAAEPEPPPVRERYLDREALDALTADEVFDYLEGGCVTR